ETSRLDELVRSGDADSAWDDIRSLHRELTALLQLERTASAAYAEKAAFDAIAIGVSERIRELPEWNSVVERQNEANRLLEAQDFDDLDGPGAATVFARARQAAASI